MFPWVGQALAAFFLVDSRQSSRDYSALCTKYRKLLGIISNQGLAGEP